MNLVDLFPLSNILLEVKAKDKKGVIREMLQVLVAQGHLKEAQAKKAEKAVQKRESQGSTGIGKGLAIPHAKGCSFLEGMVGVFARSREGLPFESVDDGLVHVLFLVVSSEETADVHLTVMKKIAKLHRDEKTIRFLTTTDSPENIRDIFKEIDDSVA